ncbi:MAG: glycerate kinase [Zetaproteobacteria bacterium]|nr:MAG: glycerate kinase [Zetaproteobacteria bacterium]
MKILLAPDSFKGSLSAREAACVMREGLLAANPNLDVILHPMADGGEGTLDVLTPSLGGKTLEMDISGMDGKPLQVPVLQFTTQFATKDHQTAWLIESAQVIGLTLPSVRSIPVLERSSAPLGSLIRKGLETGICCFYLALGGSATNDGGIGLLSKLGIHLRSGEGETMSPAISSITDMRQVDVSELDTRIGECELHLILDVDNPLLGKNGATRTYGPQKGLKPGEVGNLEGWMRQWSTCAEQAFGCDVKNKSGAGAAGGLGFALLLLGAKAHAGAAFVATLGKLGKHMPGCDWVITGEGKSDAQTLHGKVPVVVADLAHHAGTKVALISGRIDNNTPFGKMFDAVIQVSPNDMPVNQAMVCANELLMKATSGFARLQFSPKNPGVA